MAELEGAAHLADELGPQSISSTAVEEFRIGTVALAHPDGCRSPLDSLRRNGAFAPHHQNLGDAAAAIQPR